ncbi:MAG: potassium-transporting ATPase subunit C [Solirubrobacterales bacterium]|nr:potassium-transporting ATPase subunit C [Solirubrobacterales bacterium]
MISTLRAAVVSIAVFTLTLGLAYPLLSTVAAGVIAPNGSKGSLIERDGEAVGSRLIGQSFAGHPEYFQSRPSQSGYSADATFFSNAGPNGRDTFKAIDANAKRYLKREGPFTPGLTRADIPPSAVMTSASGVDPEISPEDARIQAHRVAAERKAPLQDVLALVDRHTSGRALGILGDPAVNVLELNLDLDQEYPR